MTTDLEKQFFDTFGIEQIEGLEWDCYSPDNCFKTTCVCPENCTKCEYFGKEMVYPQITDSILLELICVLASNPTRILFESMLSGIKEVELLKNSILFTCIANKDTIKHQVQALFKEG